MPHLPFPLFLWHNLRVKATMGTSTPALVASDPGTVEAGSAQRAVNPPGAAKLKSVWMVSIRRNYTAYSTTKVGLLVE